MDIGRTMTNVIRNCVAPVVARWQGALREASEQELELAAIRGEI